MVGRVLLAVRARPVLRLAAALIAFCAITVSASAQSASELERGRALFRDGVSLEAAGDWTAALQKFEQVARIRLTPQVRFHIARSKEHLGRLTEALGDYRMAEYEAAKTQAQEVGLISEARINLQRRVPRMVIEQEDAGGLQRLTLDGIELGQNQLGLELAIDPGRHRVVATWTGGATSEQEVDSREGQTTRVRLRPPKPSTPADTVPTSTLGASLAERQSSSEVRRFWPVLLGSVGIASMATGAGLLYLRHEALDKLEGACGEDRDHCRDDLRGTYTRGKLYSWLGPVVGGAGVVAVGAAVSLWLVSEPSWGKRVGYGSARLLLVSSSRGAGIELVGSF